MSALWGKSILGCFQPPMLMTHTFLLSYCTYLSMYGLSLNIESSNLPLPPYTHTGIWSRLTTCAACIQGFSKKRSALHICSFWTMGFPYHNHDSMGWAQPCGVGYHGECIRAGQHFSTRLENNKGLVLPHWAL
jgi:hypothetical protein